ncbi:MAG: VOC family protein [Gemmatimonadales bacterium]|nr:VOC family protein [Gemmatimonadales bacterium]
MPEETPRGRFVWHELLTSDMDAAGSFYRQLIGWGTAPWEGGGELYTTWTNNDQPVAGVMRLPEDDANAGVPPHWMVYIHTPDLPATVQQAKDLGGHLLHGPMDIPAVGSFAVLQDPQGAVFAAFTPAEQPGREGPVEIGEFSWHELVTTDYDKGLAFYHALFGWQRTEAISMGVMGTYQMYGRGGPSLGGMYNMPADEPAPPHWLLYVKVDDVTRAAEKVKTLGGQVLNGPMEVPGGDMVAQCIDPLGAAFAIHSTKQ